jgi:hypothetical protein
LRLQMRRGTMRAPIHDRSGLSFALVGGCGGYEIRTREGLPPTRFPTVRPGVRVGSSAS